MKLALWDSNLLSVVDGTLTKPNMATDLDTYTNRVSRDLKAQLQIATTLYKGALNIILQATSAKDCWDWAVTKEEKIVMLHTSCKASTTCC